MSGNSEKRRSSLAGISAPRDGLTYFGMRLFCFVLFFFGVKDVWVEVVGHLYLETYISYLCIPPFAPFLKSDADRQLFLMDGDTRGWQLFLRLLLSLFHVLDAFEKKKTKATPSKCSTSESPPSSLSLFHIQSIIRSSCCRYAL